MKILLLFESDATLQQATIASVHNCFRGCFEAKLKTILFSCFFFLTEHPNELQSSVAFTATTIKHP